MATRGETIESLPPALVGWIYSFLSNKECLNCAVLSKHFYNIFEDGDFWQTRYELVFGDPGVVNEGEGPEWLEEEADAEINWKFYYISAFREYQRFSDSRIESLEWAALHGHDSLLRKLLREGPDFDIFESTQEEIEELMLLHLAARGGNFKCVEILLEYEPCVTLADETGQIPMHKAAASACFESVKVFYEDNRKTLWVRDMCGETALHCACRTGALEVVTFMLERVKGAKKRGKLLNMQNEEGNTSLHVAALRGELEVARALLKKKANWKLTNIHGEQPLHCARRGQHFDMVKLLTKVSLEF